MLNLPFAIGSHDVELTVTDNGGATATELVTVTILANQPPIAIASPDQTVTDHDGDGLHLVTVDGTGSFDPNGGAITSYQWSQGSTTIGATPTLAVTLPLGSHALTLTVFDAAGFSASDVVSVTVLANQAPIAYAGADLTVSDFDNDTVESVTLDGGGSGVIDVETFSADAATVRFIGHNIHPAIAKDRMINAVRAASDFVAALPRESCTPETTS